MTHEIIAIEKHHVDREHYPYLTVKMTRKEHQKLHHGVPIDTPLARKVRQYIMLTKMIQVTKNWRIAYRKEFAENIPIDMSAILNMKKTMRNQITQIIAKDRENIQIGKGLRDILLAKILAFAHPSRFSSCRKFLHYCGYTQSARLSKKYRRDVHSGGNQIATYLVMTKDPKYYPLYTIIKQELSDKHSNFQKIKIDRMARNRIATLVFKEIYKSLVVERN